MHLAGTNGKGSTAALIERGLRAAGARTGLFTSPHLVDFRERLRLDGRLAAADDVARALARVEAVPAPPGHPRTFFEAAFGLGCALFAEAHVDWAVLECGLGGRLDATNVVTPRLAVITPIGLDHAEILGDTLEAIAGEKAGIFKPGVPAVIAAQAPAAHSVLVRMAQAVDAPLESASERARLVAIDHVGPEGSDVRFDVDGFGAVEARLALVGRHQVGNARTALAVLSLLAAREPGLGLDAACARTALSSVRWPGRFEPCPGEPRLWWDGAHNPDGARVVRAAWREALGDPPGTLVLGISADKDLDAMLGAFAGPWRRVHAVAAGTSRAVTPEALAAAVGRAWPGIEATAHASVAAGIHAALERATGDERILVAGSLFVVGEAMSAMGAAEAACS